MRGRIKHQSIIVLVDSGSTHNFIDSAIVKRLNCPTQSISGLQVTVANGDTVKTQAACLALHWEVQGFHQVTDFLVLPLQGCDLVLGIQWLKTLGPIMWNFETLTMQFQTGNNMVLLKGLQGGTIALATKKTVI